MKRICNFLCLCLLGAALLTGLSGCTCGFDCSSDDDAVVEGSTVLTLRFSDALPEDLKEVVLNVEELVFVHSVSGETRVEDFTIDSSSQIAQESFAIDLLEYTGLRNLVVLTDFELDSGFYSELIINISSNDENLSFVLTDEDEQFPITVENGALTLRDFQLNASAQDFVVEFELSRALSFAEDTGIYRLSEEGIRLQDTATDVNIEGTIDSELFDGANFDISQICEEKLNDEEPSKGNRVYLYEGNNLSVDNLADVFTQDSADAIPSSAVAPFAVASITENPNSDNLLYGFGYLPAGDYTIAFTCNAEEDDSIHFDNISIPEPAGQIYSFSLEPGDEITCNIQIDGTCNL